MRMNGNDLAACAVIALGVGGVVVGSLLGVGNQAVTLPAVNPQPVVVDMPADRNQPATPEPTPEPTPTRRDRALFRHGRRPDSRWYLFAG